MPNYQVFWTINKMGCSWQERKKIERCFDTCARIFRRQMDIRYTPIMEADVQDPSSIFKMCKRTKLLLNCVGPYLDTVQAKYFELARENGVYIVEACGIGSLPADYAITLLMKKFPGDLNSVEYYVEFIEGPQGLTINYGTYLSAIYSITDYFKASTYEELVEAEVFKRNTVRRNYPLNKYFGWMLVSYSCKEKCWCLKYLGPDVRNIKRSQMFRANYSNKDTLIETEGYLRLPFSQFLLRSSVAVLAGVLSFFTLGKTLLKKYPSCLTAGLFSRTGPTREQILECGTKITFYADGWKNKTAGSTLERTAGPDTQMKLVITGPEPAYQFTAMCMVQSGLTILEEHEKIPLEGGVYTPGVAFADTTLQKRLEKRGVTFTFEEDV